MKSTTHYFPSIKFSSLGLAGLLCLNFASAAQDPNLKIGGEAWMQYGIIGHSSDTVASKDLNGVSMYTSGAQIQLHTNLNSWESQVGLGAVFTHSIAGGPQGSNGGYAPSAVFPYVSEANFTFTVFKDEQKNFFVRGGLFDFDYNPTVANLGLYLMRGPLFPGILISGFENRFTAPVANTLGFQVHHQTGMFQQDFLVTSETEYFPYYDLTPTYVAGINFGTAFHLGAGAQYHHLFSIADSLTSGDWAKSRYQYIDTATKDTTQFTFRGIRLMVDASLDFKSFLGLSERFSASDLILYSEVALMGLKNGPAYKTLYGDMLHRMPMMVGFNIPTGKVLDRLAFEVEWYGAPFEDDLKGFNHTASSIQNPLPPSEGGVYPVVNRDNWKWSFYGSRVLQNHFKISGQVANDHFRPGIYTGDGDNAPPGAESVMQTLKDWYVMSKLAYFF